MLKNCIKNWKRIDDDMTTDVAQRERSKIKCYASAFSNILIDYFQHLSTCIIDDRFFTKLIN